MSAGPALLSNPPTIAANGRTVLLVEDEPQLRRRAARALRAAGYRVATAANGEVALREAAQSSCDVVVLDLTLPPPDGWATLRHLQRRHPGLPVLIASENDFRSMARLHGAIGMLAKPFADDALVRAVAAALAHAPVR
jgi:DNA-binding response OmpR family regulator